MCGIAGALLRQNNKETKDIVEKMIQNIVHRGPDGSGIFVDNNIGLAHRRLSIIDLSAGGHQPMSYADGNLIITYNGEIYNYIELRKELIDIGYKFLSNSDTEVILASYLEWGQLCVNRFNGMWAFAIYDKKNNIVFCSRDRFGVKPFYYADIKCGFFFGSEIRQLLPLLDHVHLNKDLLIDFLLTNISDHTNDTFFKNILKLPAGHNLIYKISDNDFIIKQYYELKKNNSFTTISEEEAITCYRACLKDSINLRLRADVSVGTCLSGGLDSSSIASIAGPIYNNKSSFKFNAITAVSEQTSNSEEHYAEQVVNYSNLNWLKVTPTYQDFLDTLPDVVRTQEEPFASTSLTMQYFVMREARKNGIPVLLDGQGGDETLLGYPKYYGSYLATTLRDYGLISFINALKSSSINNHSMSLINAVYFLLGGLIAPARFFVYLLRNNYLKQMPKYPEHLSKFSKNSMDDFELQKLEITSTNLPVLLRYEDKNSMAHSIETRLPFLDYRLVEMALSLPGHYKIHNGWSKWVLRKAMDGNMLDQITWRKNKFGFEAPEEIWLKKHDNEIKKTILASSIIKDIANEGKLLNKIDNLNQRLKWRIYSIALWEDEFKVSA